MHPLRVLLIDDGAHHVQLIRDELARQGHALVGVLDCAALVHDCVVQLAPDIVIVDSESPTRDTLENLVEHSTISAKVQRVNRMGAPFARRVMVELCGAILSAFEPMTSDEYIVLGD